MSLVFLYVQLNGKFLLIDPFHNSQFVIEPKVVLTNNTQEAQNELFTSLFATFNSQTWKNSSNIDINAVVASISILDLQDRNQQDQISYMLLQILGAYDETSNEILLELANKISVRLFSIEHMETEVYLNCIQTFYRARKGNLPFQVKQWLYTTLEKAKRKNDQLIECAVYILLAETEESKKTFQLLSKEEKSQIEDYPIGRLYQG